MEGGEHAGRAAAHSLTLGLSIIIVVVIIIIIILCWTCVSRIFAAAAADAVHLQLALHGIYSAFPSTLRLRVCVNRASLDYTV